LDGYIGRDQKQEISGLCGQEQENDEK